MDTNDPPSPLLNNVFVIDVGQQKFQHFSIVWPISSFTVLERTAFSTQGCKLIVRYKCAFFGYCQNKLLIFKVYPKVTLDSHK